jgi:hypothetical protein
MKNIPALWVLCAVGLLASAPSAPSQTQPKTHVEVPILAANPDDVGSIEKIVKASYETISGGVGVPRQWGRERSLDDPNARFVGVFVDAKTGAVTPWSTNDQEYADQTDALFVKDGFTEHELAHKIYRYGNVATVLSSYEGKALSTGKVASRGVNIFQLYYDGKRWWILSVVWDDERPSNPIPVELLQNN